MRRYPNLVIAREDVWAIGCDDSAIVKTLRRGEILEFVRVTQVEVRDEKGEHFEVRYSDVLKQEG